MTTENVPRLLEVARELALTAGLDFNNPHVATALLMGMDVGLSLAFYSPAWAQEVSEEAAAAYMAFSGKTLADKITQMDHLIASFPGDEV